MDKRYKPLPLAEQLLLRKQVVEDILAHPEWPLPTAIVHMKKTLRLTSAELAKLAGISYRTLQAIRVVLADGTPVALWPARPCGTCDRCLAGASTQCRRGAGQRCRMALAHGGRVAARAGVARRDAPEARPAGGVAAAARQSARPRTGTRQRR